MQRSFGVVVVRLLSVQSVQRDFYEKSGPWSVALSDTEGSTLRCTLLTPFPLLMLLVWTDQDHKKESLMEVRARAKWNADA